MHKIQKVITILQHDCKFGLSEMPACGAYKRRVYLSTTLGDRKRNVILCVFEFFGGVAAQLAILMYVLYTPVASFSGRLAKNPIAVSIHD